MAMGLEQRGSAMAQRLVEPRGTRPGRPRGALGAERRVPANEIRVGDLGLIVAAEHGLLEILDGAVALFVPRAANAEAVSDYRLKFLKAQNAGRYWGLHDYGTARWDATDRIIWRM